MFLVKTQCSTIQMPFNEQVVEAARTWIDTPFRHQGRNGTGIDCVGVIIEVARTLGIVDKDFDERNYNRRAPHGQAFMARFKELLVSKNCRDVAAGNIVILKEPTYPCHCGIIGQINGNFTLIHAYAPRRKVVEEYFDTPSWRDKHVATFAYPESAEWHN